ncbi:MAG: FHA domain-containing protein [Myxococcales bacterium]|nr:FHA domain-containing protein [Myxococcales bacterium]
MSMRETTQGEMEGTSSVPRVTPAYASDEMRELGEELARLYAQRDAQPDADVARDIARIRARMRTGPRLHAGEFVADGRYRLVERLPSRGVDGYWKAWDRRNTEFVFVRIFHGEWVSDPTAISAFLERGEALTKLEHPAIGRVLDADRSEGGFLYIATQMFESGSLQNATTMDAIDAIQVVVEVGRGLHAAHAQGVVHGDLNPSSVMLSTHGSAHVIGFSVGLQSHTEAASLFRAPETTERGYEPVPASDVYALGMTAVQALNGGDLPFWVLRDPGRLIHSLDVPEHVRSVLVKATEWDLSVRYPDPGAMLADLMFDSELVEALASRARERGRFDVAGRHLEALLKLQPERAVEIRTTLGEVYSALGSFDDAFTHLLAALQSSRDVTTLFAPLRTVAERTGDWPRLAKALWDQARRADDDTRVALRTELARINQFELDDPTAASETWSQVLGDHRTPTQAATALRAMIGIAESQGDWDGYVRNSDRLLDFVPTEERPKIEYGIGRAYIEHLNREELGLEYIDRAEAAGWTELDISSRLQQVRAHMGQWQRVIQLMVLQAEGQELAQASPTLLRAGIIATAVHLEEEAFAVYQALLKRAPRHVVALRHLARMHHRAHEYEQAMVYYERLWETYRGKPSEEPEASERAADCTAYAQLLIKDGRAEEATARLDESRRLAPHHVPTLRLAGPLFLGLGDTERAAAVFEQTLAVFKSVEHSPSKIEACLGMGELCWIAGRITAAMGWYNRAIELDPFSVPGWWGLAKVGLSSRGGHPGVERAPWVRATPKRYTANEALARLLAGILSPRSTRTWLSLSAMGRAMLEGGTSPMRLACCVVDVMVHNDVITPQLFERLRQSAPRWETPIGEVERLWLGGGASTFPVNQTYAWSERHTDSDFEITEVRAVLPPPTAARAVVIEDLRNPEAWENLVADAQPKPPASFEITEDLSAVGEGHAGPILALFQDGVLWAALRRDRSELTVGTDTRCDLRIPEDPEVSEQHAVLRRQGGQIYASVSEGSSLKVAGMPRNDWRLLHGDRVQFGATELDVVLVEDAHELPDEVRIPPDHTSPEDVAELQAQFLDAARSEEAPLHEEDPLDEDSLSEVSVPLPPRGQPSDASESLAAEEEPTVVSEAFPLEIEEPSEHSEPSTTSEPPPVVASAVDVEEDDPAVWDIAPDAGVEPAPAEIDPFFTAFPEEDEEEQEIYDDAPEMTRPLPDAPTQVDEAPAEVAEEPPPVNTSLYDMMDPTPPALPTVEELSMPAPAEEEGPPPLPETVEEAPAATAEPELGELPEDAPAWLRHALEAEVSQDLPTVEEEPPEAEWTVAAPESPPAEPARPAEPASPLEAPNDDSGPSFDEVVVTEPAPIAMEGTDGAGTQAVVAEAIDGDMVEFTDAGVRTPTPVPMPRTGELDQDDATETLTNIAAWIDVMSGPQRGVSVVVGPQLSVGQSDACGVSIPGDARLSPTHCVVKRTAEGFVLRDLGSATGTVVNGQRIEETPLQGGETIMVGRTVLRFRAEAS